MLLVTQATQAAQELLGGKMNSPLSLNRFKHDCHGFRANRGGNGIQISERQMHKALEKRGEPFFDFVLTGS